MAIEEKVASIPTDQGCVAVAEIEQQVSSLLSDPVEDLHQEVVRLERVHQVLETALR